MNYGNKKSGHQFMMQKINQLCGLVINFEVDILSVTVAYVFKFI